MHYARAGTVTEEMAFVAAREGMSPEFVRSEVRNVASSRADGIAQLIVTWQAVVSDLTGTGACAGCARSGDHPRQQEPRRAGADHRRCARDS